MRRCMILDSEYLLVTIKIRSPWCKVFITNNISKIACKPEFAGYLLIKDKF